MKETTPYTYLVGWDEHLILKAGVTLNRRWATFRNRGAHVYALHLADDTLTGGWVRLESEVETWLAHQFPRAFTDKAAAQPFLGPRSGGYTECYQAPTADAYRDAVAACVRIMREHGYGECATHMHGRTDGRTYGDVGCVTDQSRSLVNAHEQRTLLRVAGTL